MPIPEGLKKINAPWKNTGGNVRDSTGQTVCDDEQYYPWVDSDRLPFIAAAPDHAILLAAITAGVAYIIKHDRTFSLLYVRADEYQTKPDLDFPLTLDPFGCPVLSDECRAAILKALEAAP
jgi:hypothetical protein